MWKSSSWKVTHWIAGARSQAAQGQCAVNHSTPRWSYVPFVRPKCASSVATTGTMTYLAKRAWTKSSKDGSQLTAAYGFVPSAKRRWRRTTAATTWPASSVRTNIAGSASATADLLPITSTNPACITAVQVSSTETMLKCGLRILSKLLKIIENEHNNSHFNSTTEREFTYQSSLSGLLLYLWRPSVMWLISWCLLPSTLLRNLDMDVYLVVFWAYYLDG